MPDYGGLTRFAGSLPEFSPSLIVHDAIGLIPYHLADVYMPMMLFSTSTVIVWKDAWTT